MKNKQKIKMKYEKTINYWLEELDEMNFNHSQSIIKIKLWTLKLKILCVYLVDNLTRK